MPVLESPFDQRTAGEDPWRAATFEVVLGDPVRTELTAKFVGTAHGDLRRQAIGTALENVVVAFHHAGHHPVAVEQSVGDTLGPELRLGNSKWHIPLTRDFFAR